MIKLVASDLDGTLLQNGAQELSEELFPLIRRLKELGIMFVAASGRQYSNMKRLFGPVSDEIAYVCENGGMVVRDGKLLYENCFEPELVREIWEGLYAKEGAEVTCSTRDFYYMQPKTREFRELMAPNKCVEIKSFDEITNPCMKLAVYEEGGVTDESIRYWSERFGDKCTVVTSGFAWVDFIPFTTNKARGLEEYRKLLGIRPEECVVFGDEYNDIAMLRSIPNSFAMSHAKPGVRAAASYETDRVETILKKLIKTNGNMEEVIKCIQKNV